jgi:SET domain-containing protein
MIHSPAVCVKDTGSARGRGVFAMRRFIANEIVEVSPVVIVMNGAPVVREINLLLFNWSRLVTGKSGLQSAIALGYGSLYNGDNPANMRYEANAEKYELRFIAARDIELGEELTINYSGERGSSFSQNNSWFERMNIKFIGTSDLGRD